MPLSEQHSDHYALYFKRLAIPRFLVRAEEDGEEYVVQDANDLALKFFDLSAEQVIGRSIKSFMSAESVMHFKQSFEVCYQRKTPVTIQSLPSVPHNLRVYGFYITPVVDEKTGEIIALDVIGQVDLSDKSALQRERDDAISLMTSIFDVSEIGIIVTDENGRIVRVNNGFVRAYGWSRDELLNADVMGLVTPDQRQVARANYEDYVGSGENASGELKIIRKNGAIANILFSTSTMELSQKRRYQVTTTVDITLRKQMEESLRYAKNQADIANRAKSTFLANMSHELRTPLNAIIGFSEMMIKETFGELGHKKYKEYIGDVHSSAQHLLGIINEVLDMSKIEAGRIELDEESIDVAELLKSVLRMMASKAFGSGVEIKLNMPEELPVLWADHRLARQIFINLITNAVKFSPSGTTINVNVVLMKDGRLQVSVIDQGPGIARDKIRQALEPFGQVSESAENSTKEGTGLGLPLAKAMVEVHEGNLKLESELGQGTTVHIIFPAYRIRAREPR